MIEKIKLALSGKKTYLVAIVTIVGGIVTWLNNGISVIDLIQLIVGSLFASTLRNGVKTETK